jgi:serine/threonine protein kinase
MAGDSSSDDSVLSLSAKNRIDRICLAFEDAWKSDRQPQLEQCLGDASEPELPALLRELLLLEFHYRRCRGETPSEADYLARFPDHPQVVAEAWQKARQAGGPSSDGQPQETPPTSPFTGGEEVPCAPGEMIGRYKVLRWLGGGGQGDVYLAWDDQLCREVAIKIPRRDRFKTAAEQDRFLEEARTAARLKHPSIVPVHDFGRHTDGIPFVVMDYVEGRPLTKVLRSGRLSYRRLAGLMIQVADAVQYAHDLGVVHRDLKPANILIDAEGRPLITDFGLAERWEPAGGTAQFGTPELAGTLGFIPPELFVGTGRVGPATDIYALGVTMYEALTGRNPFEGRTPMEVMPKVLLGEPRLPKDLRQDVPEPLQRICLKAMERAPEERYESAQMVIEDLRRFVEGRPVLARPKRYNVELSGKLDNHYNDIRAWREQGLITVAEMDRLMRPYWFMREKLEEEPGPRAFPRLLPWEALLIRLGGWFVLLGTLLWVIRYWEELGPGWGRLVSVGLPTLGLNLAGWIFYSTKSRWNTRIFLAIGALLVPLLVAVALCESHWPNWYQDQKSEVFEEVGRARAYLAPGNLQLTLAAAAFLAYSGLLLRVCRRRVSVLWVGIGIYCLFTGVMLLCGLKRWFFYDYDHRAWALLYYVVLCILFCPAALWWSARGNKREPAWLFIFFPVPFVLLMTALGCYGSVEWLGDEARWQLQKNETANLWWMANGAVYWLAAILCLRAPAGFIRFWGSFFLFLVPVSLLLPANLLFYEGRHVIEGFGERPLTIYELLCFLFAVGLVVIGSKLSQATLAVPGLIGLGVVVFRVARDHFGKSLTFPLAVALGGTAAILAGAVSWFVRYRLRRRST